jgi:hypothetical protein
MSPLDGASLGRCVPFLDDASLGKCVPWTMRPLDNASLGRCVPWKVSPLDGASLGRCVPWSMRSLDVGTSLGRCVPIMDSLMGCNVSPSLTGVSLTENSWMLHPLDKVSLGYCAPDQTIPSLKFRLFSSFLNIILGGFYGT